MLRAPTELFSSRTSSVVSWRLMFIISLDSGRFHLPIAQDARPCERFPVRRALRRSSMSDAVMVPEGKHACVAQAVVLTIRRR